MLKFLSIVAMVTFVSLGLANCSPLRGQVAQPARTELRTLVPPRSVSNADKSAVQSSNTVPLEARPVGSPASLTLGKPTQLPPPPSVSLGIPVQLRPPPTVTLGIPAQQQRSPQVNLGLPEVDISDRRPTRFVSDGPTLAELALPPELGGAAATSTPTSSTPTNEVGGGGVHSAQAPAAKASEVKPTHDVERRATLQGSDGNASHDAERRATLLEDLLFAPEEASSQLESLPPPPRAPQELESPSRGPGTQPPFNPLDALPPSMLESVPQSSQSTESVPLADTQPAGAGDTADANNRFSNVGSADRAKKPSGPYFFGVAGDDQPPSVDAQAWHAPYTSSAFSPQPSSAIPSSPQLEASPYRDKFEVPTQRPWVELWRPFYTGGIYPPAQEWFGRYNLAMPSFIVYGDFRTGAAINRNAKGDTDNVAGRLNLDMDLRLTATERLHAFMGPLDRNGDFTKLDFTHGLDFFDRSDIRFDNLFFEGDMGAIWGGLTDQNSPFDLPFSFGFLPLLYQNGIWANDNVIGAAMALPSKNSPLLKWSNYDATFFWASDQVNTDAFIGDNNAAEFFGTAWFIEAYDGFIEADYAFVHDDVGGHRSYHNLSLAYTRRYFMQVSNSIRYITNFGQSLPSDQRTADGHMILLENSLISKAPNTVVPYLNFFYGQGRTQSLARANAAGGVLNNTGINFETDGLTGYPTLDATGVNASGAALGINMLGADFQHQLILELAALSANGQAQLRNAPGNEYAVGMRYQRPLSNAWIFRTDHMVGWRENARELQGSRVELRWKF